MQIGSVQSLFQNSGLQPLKVEKPSSALAYYDPKDTNQDGVVSTAESLAYSLKHPEWDRAKPSSAVSTKAATTADASAPLPYTAKGTQSPSSRPTNAFLDLKG